MCHCFTSSECRLNAARAHYSFSPFFDGTQIECFLGSEISLVLTKESKSPRPATAVRSLHHQPCLCLISKHATIIPLWICACLNSNCLIGSFENMCSVDNHLCPLLLY